MGFALIQQQETPPYRCMVPHRFTYLTDLVVDPLEQEKGIGTILIEEVKQWSKKKGSDYVELGVLSQNRRAIALYEKMDFEECMKTMRTKL
ncbi:GNAT family N-acetyltransferase [Clostridium minihomine]|uniref:GNAT family N-acetyltransferase n=1 Tax=Clostridium minihomine TaxID=2045012 RepID=UPI0027955DB2|nr:GNAT family N-acetyltransferase [Clostridium minihomine]